MSTLVDDSRDIPATWLDRAAAAHPESDALLTPAGESVCFAELRARTRQLADALARTGVGAGDAIGVCGLPAFETALLLHAAGRLGCALVPVDPRRPGQWRTAVWLESGVGRAFSSTDELAVLDDQGAAPAEDEGIRATPDGVHLIVATSSSGGEPRGAMLTGRNIAASVHACRERLGLQAHDRWLVCLPLHHLGGLAVLYRCAQAGACAVLHDRFDPERVWRDLAAQRVTHLSLVPAMLAHLLDAAREAPPPGSLRRLVVGGAEVSPGLLASARSAGWPVCPAYSCTETCSQIAACLPEEHAPPGCVGRPLDAFDVQVIDHHGHPTWDVGRIRVSGEAVMAGYASPDRRPGLGLDDGWFTTGDLGRLDSGGRLWVTGRADDILVTGGENVHPRQVEEVLQVCPDIGEVAVTGRPDPVWGATLVAVYTGSIGESELAGWCREHLHGALRPRAFVRVQSLPRLGHGKVDRKSLSALGRAP